MKTERFNSFSCCSLADKEKKNLVILDLIRRKSPISRTEISKITGLNIVTVSNYINNYLTKKILLEKGFDISSGGRKPELIELNKDSNYTIGIGMSDENTKISMTNLDLKVIEKIETGPVGYKDKDFVKRIIALIEEVIEKSAVQKDAVKSIGLGISDEEAFAAGGAIQNHFNIKTFIGRCALCAAFGEKRLNPAADRDDVLYIYSDLGHGVMIKKDVCIDAFNAEEFSAESKYLKPWDESMGIVHAARKEVTKGVGTSIVDIANGKPAGITQGTIIEAARQNDKVALDIVQSVAINMGLRLAYLANLFNPQVIVIGDGIEKAGKIFFDSVINMVRKFAFRRIGDNIKIIPSSLGEEAVSLGANSLAVREIFLDA